MTLTRTNRSISINSGRRRRDGRPCGSRSTGSHAVRQQDRPCCGRVRCRRIRLEVARSHAPPTGTARHTELSEVMRIGARNRRPLR
jgi:hypothetical protein